MQRLLDILFSAIALIFLSPIFLLVIIVLRFTGEGEIFFFQTRHGQSSQNIRLIKFVTMVKNSENIGTGTVTLKNDPRVLPFGIFLRKTKLNELPQIINVFLGDMSVIGPRPQTERCFNAFPEELKSIISSIRPGLSGIGSIVFRNEEDMMDAAEDPDRLYDEEIMPYKAKLESWYKERNNIKMYFMLIFLTVFIIISHNPKILWKIFPNLPLPPKSLKKYFD